MIASWNRVALLVLLLVLAPLAGCRQQAPPPLLTINGQEISLARFLDDFNASLQQQEPLPPERRLQLQRTYMARLVDRVLLEQEARKRNIVVTPQEVDAAMGELRSQYPDDTFKEALVVEGTDLTRWRQGMAHRLLVEKLTQAVVKAQVEVTDEEVRQYYHEHEDDYRRPAQVRARQLVVATEEEGRQAQERLREGESFAAVAREVSLSPDAEEGGDLGFFARGEMPPEFDAVVFHLPVGRVSDLVHTPYGWHLFLVEEKRPAVRRSLDEAAGEIRQQLQRQQEEAAYQSWLQGVRARARIEIDWNLLAQQDTE